MSVSPWSRGSKCPWLVLKERVWGVPANLEIQFAHFVDICPFTCKQKIQHERLFLQTMSPDSDLKIHLGWNWVKGAGQKTWDGFLIKSWIGIGCVYKDVLKNCHLFHIKSHLMSKNSVHSNSIEVIRPDFHVGTKNWQVGKFSFCEKFSKSQQSRFKAHLPSSSMVRSSSLAETRSSSSSWVGERPLVCSEYLPGGFFHHF